MTTRPFRSRFSAISRLKAVEIDSAKIRTPTPSPTVASVMDDLNGERARPLRTDRSVRMAGAYS